MSGGVVFWPWAECVVALFIYISAIITKAKLTRIGDVVLGCTQFKLCLDVHTPLKRGAYAKLRNKKFLAPIRSEYTCNNSKIKIERLVSEI